MTPFQETRRMIQKSTFQEKHVQNLTRFLLIYRADFINNSLKITIVFYVTEFYSI